jgi:hypothetical protein
MFDHKIADPGGAAGACVEDHRQGENGQSYTPSYAPRQARYLGRWRVRDSSFRPPPDELGDAEWFQNHPHRNCRLRRLTAADFAGSRLQDSLPWLLVTQIDGCLVGVVIPNRGLPDAHDDAALRQRFLEAIDDSPELRAAVALALEGKP